jgi:Transposase IS200 like
LEFYPCTFYLATVLFNLDFLLRYASILQPLPLSPRKKRSGRGDRFNGTALALYVAQRYGRRRKYRGYHFWARGYFVSTVGLNEEVVRRYIQTQEKEDKKIDQLNLFEGN